MKKILFSLTFLFIPFVSFAAISASTVWEVRTAGATTNGCGFVTGASGSDYSQQDSAQISRTDLVIGNPDTTTLTSSATPFTTAEVGNLIQITAGTNFTTGFYEITGVDGSNIATVDRSVGTAGATGGTGAVGGACSHPQTVAPNIVAGNQIYIKVGTYNRQGANAYVLNFSVAGALNTPILWIGYNATRTDTPTGANRPVLDMASASTNVLINTNNAARNFFYNFIFKRSTGTCLQMNATVPSPGPVFVNSRFTACGTDAIGGGSGFSAIMINVECDTNSDACIDSNAASVNIVCAWCYIHDNTNEGIEREHNSGGITIHHSIIDSNGQSSGGGSVAAEIWQSVLYNNTGASNDGWQTTAGNALSIYNNAFVSNGRYGYNESTNADVAILDYNLTSGNGTAPYNNAVAGIHDVTSAPSFTDATNGDFTYLTGSPAINSAMPISNGAVGSYKWNIGVDQGDHAATSNSGIVSFK